MNLLLRARKVSASPSPWSWMWESNP